MSRLINRVDQTFGKLLVTARGPDYISPSGNRKVTWICLCECGQIVVVNSDNLAGGLSTSCGCHQREVVKELSTTHGMSKGNRTYVAWRNMIQRCTDPNKAQWKDYGGRGITVCERWQKFENFLADMGEVPPGRSIDRIDNNGNYEPGNCQWATRKQQDRNKRSNRPITWKGRTQPVMSWSEELGIGYRTLLMRLNLGWSVERAFTTPVG